MDDKQRDLVLRLRGFLNDNLAALDRMDETDEFPYDLAARLWDEGVLKLMLPPRYGGDGRVTTLCACVEEIARFSGGLALLAVVQATGTVPVVLDGSPELQSRYFQSVADRHYMAFALSETNAGSDARAIGTRIEDGGDHFEIDGSKWFATNGGIADHYIIFGRHVKDGQELGYSTVIVDKGTPGFSFAPKNDLFGMRGVPTTSLLIKKVKVPKSHLLGRPGDGFKLAMRTLDHSRPVIGAQSVGLAQAALDIAVNHCRKRKVFGKNLGNLDGVRMMLADMAAGVDASRLLVYRAAEALDRGSSDATQYSAMAKFFASDTAMKVAVDAIQLLGGFGCFRGRTLDRIMRDAKITQIYEGANQIQRLVVGRQLLQTTSRNGSRVLQREDDRSMQLLGEKA